MTMTAVINIVELQTLVMKQKMLSIIPDTA